jgi:hypothetical protein
MSSRSRTSTESESTLRPTSDTDHDLDQSPALDTPPDDPPAPPVVEVPDPDSTPPGWMLSQAQALCNELPLYPISRLPALRFNVIRAMSEPYPLLDITEAAIRAAFCQAAPLAMNFTQRDTAEVSAVHAWLIAVMKEIAATRAAGFARATEQKRLEDEAERNRLWRIEHSVELAEAGRWAAYEAQQADFAAYKAGLAGDAQPVA